MKAASGNGLGAPHPFGWRRVAWLLTLTGLVAGVVIDLQVSVPLPAPSLGHADLIAYWPVAVIAGLAVLILTAAVVWATVRAGRGGE